MRARNTMARASRILTLSLVLLSFGGHRSAAQGQARVWQGFVLQSELGPASQVIDSPEALAQFIACLPERLPHMKEPAPLNDDPLREPGFSLDFEHSLLVVCVHRDTISAFPEYKGNQAEPDARMVDFDVPSPPPEARPYDWGVYTAVLLPKGDLPTRIRTTEVEGNW